MPGINIILFSSLFTQNKASPLNAEITKPRISGTKDPSVVSRQILYYYIHLKSRLRFVSIYFINMHKYTHLAVIGRKRGNGCYFQRVVGAEGAGYKDLS